MTMIGARMGILMTMMMGGNYTLIIQNESMTAICEIERTLSFVNSIIKEERRRNYSDIVDILDISKDITMIYSKYPNSDIPQFNLLKLMQEDENEVVHSRILKALLSQSEKGSWTFLSKFLEAISQLELDIHIESPIFVNEYTNRFSTKRIDLLIYEKTKYAIIIENKSNNAPYQRHQLANYIDMMLEEGYKEEQIYVILLADNHPPSDIDAIWISENHFSSAGAPINYEKCFKTRFYDCSFRYDILPWLKEVKDINQDDEIFTSLQTQYIDFLEQKFESSKYNTPRMNEIKEYLKEALALTGESTHDIATITSKVNDVRRVLDHLRELQNNVIDQYMSDFERELRGAFPNNEIATRFLNGRYPTVSLHLKSKDTLVKIGVPFQIDRTSGIQYYGIEPLEEGTKDSKCELTANAIQPIGGFKKHVNWCYLKNTNFENALDSVKELVSVLKEQGWE